MAFSTEQVSKWHPDKYADQISDAILTAYLRDDKYSHCGIETLVKGTTVVLAGEITSQSQMDKECRAVIAHRVGKKLGYEVGDVIDLISEQSPEINKAVTRDKTAAGDQGMVYGYAVKGEGNMPKGFNLANKLIKAHENRVWTGLYQGDAKCQVVTDDNDKVTRIVFSACQNHESHEALRADVRRMIDEVMLEYDEGKVEYLINPAGPWKIGGPTADCGLTGRKIVCDQYGGYAPVGGGAFSGKDPSKVDRTGAYMARSIACDLVKYCDAKKAEVQMGFAIGVPEPVSVQALVDGKPFDEKKIRLRYDLSVDGMIEYLNLYKVDFEKVAEGCHYRKGGVI